MVRGLVITLFVLMAACNGGSDAPLPALQARIAPDVAMTLPTPPGYPETRTVTQIVRSRYLGAELAVEAVLSLGPEETIVVMTVPGGPRLATITWGRAGVRSERAPLVPEGAPVENILSDIFFVLWPPEAISRALPQGVELVVSEDGSRALRSGSELIMEATTDPSNPNRQLVRNHALGYEVTIVTRSLE